MGEEGCGCLRWVWEDQQNLELKWLCFWQAKKFVIFILKVMGKTLKVIKLRSLKKILKNRSKNLIKFAF